MRCMVASQFRATALSRTRQAKNYCQSLAENAGVTAVTEVIIVRLQKGGKSRNINDAGWSSLVARRAHNPKVVSSNLTPATMGAARQIL